MITCILGRQVICLKMFKRKIEPDEKRDDGIWKKSKMTQGSVNIAHQTGTFLTAPLTKVDFSHIQFGCNPCEILKYVEKIQLAKCLSLVTFAHSRLTRAQLRYLVLSHTT